MDERPDLGGVIDIYDHWEVCRMPFHTGYWSNATDWKSNPPTEEELTGLRPRTRDIIERRLGINGHKQHTLAQVSEIHSISRERARQIEGNCLAELAEKRLRLSL